MHTAVSCCLLALIQWFLFSYILSLGNNSNNTITHTHTNVHWQPLLLRTVWLIGRLVCSFGSPLPLASCFVALRRPEPRHTRTPATHLYRKSLSPSLQKRLQQHTRRILFIFPNNGQSTTTTDGTCSSFAGELQVTFEQPTSCLKRTREFLLWAVPYTGHRQ